MKTIFATVVSLVSLSANANPIYLQPGQCYIVAMQTICAAQTQVIQQPTPAPLTAVYCTCEAGIHKQDNPMAPMKGFGLYRTVEGKQGEQLSRTLVKMFYEFDDKACMKASQSLPACKVGL